MSATPFDREGQVAVVTGGAQGIGAAIVEEMVRGGATVVVADVQDQVGQAAAERLTEKGAGRAEYRRLDVTDGASVAAVADAIVQAHGRVDVLVNNAGIAESSPTFELDEATWQKRST